MWAGSGRGEVQVRAGRRKVWKQGAEGGGSKGRHSARVRYASRSEAGSRCWASEGHGISSEALLAVREGWRADSAGQQCLVAAGRT